MSTSKDNQIKVLEKATENIKNALWYREGIQFYSHKEQRFVDCIKDERPFLFDFDGIEFRVKRKTVHLFDGIEIPAPLTKEEVAGLPWGAYVFFISTNEEGYTSKVKQFVEGGDFSKVKCYATEEEAKEASRILFGEVGI